MSFMIWLNGKTVNLTHVVFQKLWERLSIRTQIEILFLFFYLFYFNERCTNSLFTTDYGVGGVGRGLYSNTTEMNQKA